ncbi:MAG: hypothetical protein EAX95_11595 [Candidatus Thorarchaeota archaeon]|nr:hypothetical protein [Candidatus Thorarchaeota archaeon]
MKLVGIASGVHIYAPDDSYISYFNSPYIGHRRCSAIDIYPSHGDWNGPAIAPCDGKVSMIRRTRMGRKKPFPTEDFDYAIGITPDDQDDTVVRVLHCSTPLEIGDRVSCGDHLGHLIRSRYFNYWTGPHYHIEAMNPAHFVRPSQSYPISVEKRKLRLKMPEISNQIVCEILKCTRDLVICGSRELPFVSCENHYGHLAMTGESFGIMDAGVPHYNQGGILIDTFTEAGSQVKAFGTSMGHLLYSTDTLAQFVTEKGIVVILEGERISGLSTHLYSKSQLISGHPPLFLIPKTQGQFEDRFSKGDQVVLSVEAS